MGEYTHGGYTIKYQNELNPEARKFDLEEKQLHVEDKSKPVELSGDEFFKPGEHVGFSNFIIAAVHAQHVKTLEEKSKSRVELDNSIKFLMGKGKGQTRTGSAFTKYSFPIGFDLSQIEFSITEEKDGKKISIKNGASEKHNIADFLISHLTKYAQLDQESLKLVKELEAFMKAEILPPVTREMAGGRDSVYLKYSSNGVVAQANVATKPIFILGCLPWGTKPLTLLEAVSDIVKQAEKEIAQGEKRAAEAEKKNPRVEEASPKNLKHVSAKGAREMIRDTTSTASDRDLRRTPPPAAQGQSLVVVPLEGSESTNPGFGVESKNPVALDIFNQVSKKSLPLKASAGGSMILPLKKESFAGDVSERKAVSAGDSRQRSTSSLA